MRSFHFNVCAFVSLSLLFFSPQFGFTETITDTETFNENETFWGTALWTHTIPKNSLAESVEIKVIIRVSSFNDWGVLDLFCSNTNEFDYGSATTAPTKPGFILRIHRTDVPQSDTFYEIGGTLSPTQIGWLGDDSMIHIALIGLALPTDQLVVVAIILLLS